MSDDRPVEERVHANGVAHATPASGSVGSAPSDHPPAHAAAVLESNSSVHSSQPDPSAIDVTGTVDRSHGNMYPPVPSDQEASLSPAPLQIPQGISHRSVLHRDSSLLTSGPLESCMENSVRIVKGEIHNVLSLMRLNRRYSSGARFIREIPATAESPLVRGLKDLHDSLATFTDLQEIDTLLWLRPFFDVIESPETSGPITGGALSSLSKFLLPSI